MARHRSPCSRGPIARALPALIVLAWLAAGGCGGGGGSAPEGTYLGVVARTVPTEVAVAFTNPLGDVATLTEPAPGTPFRVREGLLPLEVGAGAAVSLPVACTPTSDGAQQGTLTLLWQGASASSTTSHVLRSTAETVRLVASPQVLDFGAVAAGATSDLVLSLSNPSALSPVTLNEVLPTGEGLSLTTSLPLTVPPGGTGALGLRLVSASGGALDGSLAVGPSDAGAGLTVQVSANRAARQDLIDFGIVALQGSLTPTLSVFVPEDAISLTLQARSSTPSARLGLEELRGPGERVYEAPGADSAYRWVACTEAFACQVPNTDQPGLQLVAGGGTYSFRLRADGAYGPGIEVRAIVERRPAGSSPASVLDLNVWLAQALPAKASTAAGDVRLQEILATLDSVLQGQGIRLGAIDYYDVTDPRFDMVSEPEFPEMLRLTAAATHVRLNLFFVVQAHSGAVTGVAGTITGPSLNGTAVSGVMCQYDGLDTVRLGTVAAHEIGHYLGLWHTTEQGGSHDAMDDTLPCPTYGTVGSCGAPGGGYLMFWLINGPTTITDGQGRVIRGHALVAPDLEPPSKRRAAPAWVATVDPSLPAGWCGTCQALERAGR